MIWWLLRPKQVFEKRTGVQKNYWFQVQQNVACKAQVSSALTKLVQKPAQLEKVSCLGERLNLTPNAAVDVVRVTHHNTQHFFGNISGLIIGG